MRRPEVEWAVSPFGGRVGPPSPYALGNPGHTLYCIHCPDVFSSCPGVNSTLVITSEETFSVVDWCHLVCAEFSIHLLLSNSGTVSTKSRMLFSYLYHPIAIIGSFSIFLKNLKGLPFMNCPTIDQVSQGGKCRKSHKTSQFPKILRLMNIPRASAMGVENAGAANIRQVVQGREEEPSNLKTRGMKVRNQNRRGKPFRCFRFWDYNNFLQHRNQELQRKGHGFRRSRGRGPHFVYRERSPSVSTCCSLELP